MNTTLEAAGKWRKLAGFTFVAIAFVFLAIFLFANLREVRQHQWTIRPELLALSLAIQIAGLASGALAWQLLLRGMGTHVRLVPLARVRFVSGLARFIPGKIWPFIGAAQMGTAFGIPAAVTITSLAAHTVFSTIGALIISVYFLPLSVLPGLNLELLRWIAPLLLLLAHPRVIAVALHLVSRMTRRHIAAWTGTWLDGLWLVVVAMIGWIITGVALVLFILSVTPLPGVAFSAVVGVNALSFVLGQAFFIAPAGLGAKEGTTAAVLALYVSVPVAALLAVGVRLWTTMSEVIIAFALMHWRSSDA